MKLQARFLLLFIFMFACAAMLLVLQRYSDLDRSRFLLNNELGQRHGYFERIIKITGQPLESLSVDYSFWDDMIAFIKKPNSQFSSNNIDTGLGTYGANVAWVYRPDSSLVYFKSVDGDPALKNLALPKAFFDRLATTHFEHFFLQEPGGLLEIRAASVHAGNDSERKTPAQGYWVIGQYWNADYLKSLGELTQSTATIKPATSSANDQISGNTVSFGTKLTDWDGQTVAILNSSADVPVVKDLETLYTRQLVLLLLLMVVSLVVAVFSIWLLVLRPVGAIGRSLQRRDPAALDSLAQEQTEFGQLARTVQQVYSQELKIKESEFLKSKLFELNAAKGEFLAVAAHELKGPVGNVHIFAENLADLVKEKTSKKILLAEVQRISQQAHKATVLINDIYQASKGGQVLDLHRTNFDFDEFVRSEVENAQYSTPQKLVLEGATGQTITSDIDRLGQVMTNLIRNASKYSPHTDTIIIRLKAERDHVVVEVQDFGLGISPEDQKHLFERFFRSSQVVTSYPGLGLGLSICREIVEALGGKMWLESELGTGSHFYFSLPGTPKIPELS